MRHLILLMFILLSFSSYAQINEAWFQYNPVDQSYSIDARNVHPVAFFNKLSLTSGIEIQYHENISFPINYYANESKLSQIIEFLEREFSTLLAFKKNKDNQDILTRISVLPKGQFRTSRMISAVEPVKEAIHFKNQPNSSKAKTVYLTRMDHLEMKVRERLEHQAERTIKKQEKRSQRINEMKQRKRDRKQAQLAELANLKQTDPKLYAAKKAIYFSSQTKKE